MNVVIFGKGFGKPRQLNLSGPVAWTAMAAFAMIVSAAGFAGGYWVSSKTGSGVSLDRAQELARIFLSSRKVSRPFVSPMKIRSKRWRFAWRN